MKIQIIKGTNGCQEIEVNIDEINGVTSDRDIRMIFLKGNKYRLTVNSHKMLIKELKQQQWLNKSLVC